MIEKRNCEIELSPVGERAKLEFMAKHIDDCIVFHTHNYSSSRYITIDGLTIEDLKDLQNKIKNLIPVLEKEKINAS